MFAVCNIINNVSCVLWCCGQKSVLRNFLGLLYLFTILHIVNFIVAFDGLLGRIRSFGHVVTALLPGIVNLIVVYDIRSVVRSINAVRAVVGVFIPRAGNIFVAGVGRARVLLIRS